MAKCECDFCSRDYPKFREMMWSTDGEVRSYIEELFNHWQDTAADLNYSEAILDGSWPQAVEILEKSLERAKETRALRADRSGNNTTTEEK